MRTAALLVLVLILAACRQTPQMGESPGPEIDPFFRLAFADEAGGPPVDGEWPKADGDAYLLTFRFLVDLHSLSAPSLAIAAGERAQVRLVNQVSYIADFDVEIACEAFIADPIISILQDGLTLEASALPEKGGDGIVLAWHIDLAELQKPMRRRNLEVHASSAPVTVELPATALRTATGRVLLRPGVETSILRLSGEQNLSVLVCANPVELADDPKIRPSDEFNLVPGPARPELEDTPSGLTELLDRDAPPADARISVVIATTESALADGARHLDAAAGERFVAGLTELRRADLAAIPEAGAGVGWQLTLSYHGDSAVRKAGEDSVLDPEIDTVEIGFSGRFAVHEGTPVIGFEYSVFREFIEQHRTKNGVIVMAERPAATARRGVLHLRGAVDVMPIGKLKDGRTVVLVVRRAVPR